MTRSTHYQFNNMKNLILLILSLLIFTSLFSCTKNGESPLKNKSTVTTHSNFLTTPTSIIGKWNLVNDSLVWGVGPYVTTTNYIGKSGDYFDFEANNKLYIKEGANLDSSVYQVMSDSTVVLDVNSERYNGVAPVSKIVYTPGGVTLHSPAIFVANPGSYYLHIVNLKK
jgi:hypothetical protein